MADSCTRFRSMHLGESALLCGQTVPEAIHNQVAIKLLKSGLLT